MKFTGKVTWHNNKIGFEIAGNYVVKHDVTLCLTIVCEFANQIVLKIVYISWCELCCLGLRFKWIYSGTKKLTFSL